VSLLNLYGADFYKLPFSQIKRATYYADLKACKEASVIQLSNTVELSLEF